MVMKDKLIKFGHKRGYYYAKESFLVFMGLVAVFSVVAIPTYISETSTIARAKEIEDKDEDEETEKFLSVNDID